MGHLIYSKNKLVVLITQCMFTIVADEEKIAIYHHIDSICGKARKILGMLYRRFSHDTEPYALLQLYLSLVRPYLQYAGSQVWDLHLQKDINQRVCKNLD